jgi:hypothetical protein
MKTAIEIYDSSNREEIGSYFIALDGLGQQGQLAKLLLRAQRTGERERRAAQQPDASPYGDYLRLMHSRNDFAVRELIMFCTEPWHNKGFSIKKFKYGIRVIIRKRHAFRFRKVDQGRRWQGDSANLEPICDYCDELMKGHYGESKHTGKLFGWPTAI